MKKIQRSYDGSNLFFQCNINKELLSLSVIGLAIDSWRHRDFLHKGSQQHAVPRTRFMKFKKLKFVQHFAGKNIFLKFFVVRINTIPEHKEAFPCNVFLRHFLVSANIMIIMV